jgi:PAS domain S-box-containing protein
VITDDLYREIFEKSPTSLLLTDSRGSILAANPCALNLLGYCKDELIDHAFEEILPFKVFDGDLRTKELFSSFNEILDVYEISNEFLVQKKDGEVFFAELRSSTSTNISLGELRVWSIRAILHEKKLIHDLKERIKEQLALLRVTETLFKCTDINEALSECVRHIRDGWQFPEYTVVRIKLNDGSGYMTDGFMETNWRLISKIESNNQTYGTVEVYYTVEVETENDSLFLQEEKKLIDGFARLLSIFLDQLHAMNRLKEKDALIIKITDQIPGNTYQFEIDEKGYIKILFASKGTDSLSGDYKAEELIENATKITDLIHPEDKDRYYECMRNAYQNHNDLSVQYRIQNKNTVKWRWLRATSEKTAEGKVLWYGSSQDITPFINYIDMLEQILFDISHVIRRPVTTMLGLTKLMENLNIADMRTRELVDCIKTVALEMDEYTRHLNDVYQEKKLGVPINKMGF